MQGHGGADGSVGGAAGSCSIGLSVGICSRLSLLVTGEAMDLLPEGSSWGPSMMLQLAEDTGGQWEAPPGRALMQGDGVNEGISSTTFGCDSDRVVHA